MKTRRALDRLAGGGGARAAAIGATSALSESRRAAATSRNACQNSAPSEMLGRWPARTTERFLTVGVTSSSGLFHEAPALLHELMQQGRRLAVVAALDHRDEGGALILVEDDKKGA